jgi:DNA-directed RNA polymerase subunit RPC12/RpoP
VDNWIFGCGWLMSLIVTDLEGPVKSPAARDARGVVFPLPKFTNIWYNPCMGICVRCSEVGNMKTTTEKTMQGQVHCPICTHTVGADIDITGRKKASVVPGQKCPRCSSTLDAAYVMQVLQAA